MAFLHTKMISEGMLLIKPVLIRLFCGIELSSLISRFQYFGAKRIALEHQILGLRWTNLYPTW